jgi:hypothetical protein
MGALFEPAVACVENGECVQPGSSATKFISFIFPQSLFSMNNNRHRLLL